MHIFITIMLLFILIIMIAHELFKKVRTPYDLIACLSQEAPKRGRSRAGGDVSCRPAVRPHRPPSQEWHGVASGEACGVYVRVCGGVWGAERDYCSST